MKEGFDRMLRHLAWADRRIGEALAVSRGEPPEAVKLYAHVVGAEQIWLARLEGRGTAGLAVFPDWDLDACAAASNESIAGYERYLANVFEPGLKVTYRNTQGAEFVSSAADILTHMFLHGSYHRGQINARLRAAGFEPTSVDYIVYVRELERSDRT